MNEFQSLTHNNEWELVHEREEVDRLENLENMYYKVEAKLLVLDHTDSKEWSWN